ncbi:MAG: hypothetical protein ABI583_03610 [Betaproteobacteria bacterium]
MNIYAEMRNAEFQAIERRDHALIAISGCNWEGRFGCQHQLIGALSSEHNLL